MPLLITRILFHAKALHRMDRHKCRWATLRAGVTETISDRKALLDSQTPSIGSDYHWTVTTGKIRRLTNGLTAIETSFGWTLQGAVKSAENIRGTFSTCGMKALAQNFSDDNEKLSQQLQAFSEVDQMGILNHKDQESVEDAVLTKFKIFIQRKGHKYEVCFSWKNNAPELDCNPKKAKDRLAKLTRCVQKNERLLIRYDARICEYVDDNFAEPATTHEAANPGYYLQLRALTHNDSETTKTHFL
ncbi:hypothetical protein HPB48_008108 [Haemaphysalis longicornis]|uniref:Uncharacterized protein n=1 Tax=Haemaphysalis longicornis TaxID=44386 RepID=A0A9J6GVT8_HAELO|nr:hypothetical protein HPB48_008108 [Haemaphysalis longicornis]